MNRFLMSLFGLYLAGFAISLIGCSSDNIPKGTIRTGIGVPTSIALKVVGDGNVIGRIADDTQDPAIAAAAANFSVIATVKDELGNPAAGFNVIFTTSDLNAVVPQSIALVAGTAKADFVLNSLVRGTFVSTVFAQVEDISASINVTATFF